MKTGLALASVRTVGGLERVDYALRRLEEGWERGHPDLDAIRSDPEAGGSVSVLAALVKADLGYRYARGEHPEAREYLARYPELTGDGDRVLSLVYEEYCLREERGDRPDTLEFCERYATWKDSLASQLRYHRVISRVVGPPPPAVRFPAAGESFEHFRICHELGRGGAARVYLACDEKLGGREVALKVSLDRGNEPSILGRLEHDHIITVLSVWDQPETHLRGLCMPYRPGLPLEEVIRRVDPASRPGNARARWDALAPPPPAPPTATATQPPTAPAPAPPGGELWATFPARGSYVDGVAWVVATLAEALHYAHREEIYHRDVKPANVLLTYRDGPQLLDFNLSHDPNSAVQADEALRGGTLPYMAPEQLEAFLNPDHWEDVKGQADLYSLGLVLRELLTGQGPETPDPSLPLPRAIRLMLDRRPDLDTDLRRVNPSIPHAMEAIVRRCLTFAPGDRYRDAGELASDLRRHLERRPLDYASNSSKRERTFNWLRRHRVRLAVAAVAAVAAVYLLADWFTPAVERPAFLRAVWALEQGRPFEAINQLNTLPGRDFKSPVVGLHHAWALAWYGQGKDADSKLGQLWGVPGAERALVAWGRQHRGFAEWAENLGTMQANDVSLRDDPVLGRGVLDHAERTLRMALVIDPGRHLARQTLAMIAEIRSDFASAHHILTGLIVEEGDPADAAGYERIWPVLQSRARVSCHWARSLMGLLRPGDDPARPEALCVGGLADLDLADRFVEGNAIDTQFDRNYIRCEITLILAAIARHRGRVGEANRLHRKAKELLLPLSTHGPERQKLFDDISRKVKEHLPPETPRDDSIREGAK